MPVNAKFLADFEDFYRAVQKAEGSLKAFESGADKAAAAVDAVSTHAPAQVATLNAETRQATVSFENMGKTVRDLAGMFGIAFGVGQLISFGQEALAAADDLMKFHDRTGITVEGLQRLQVAGDDAGNTLDELTAAVNKLQNKLAGGDRTAVEALEKLNISFQDIKQLSPEQQFMQISDAIRGIEDPAEQVNIAMALFGKQGAIILPTLKRGFDDVRDAAVGMSTDTAQWLDKLGDSAKAASRSLKGDLADTLNFLFGGWGENERAAERFAKQMENVKPPIGLVNDAAKALTSSEIDLHNIERELNDAARESIELNRERERGLEQVRKKIEEIEKGSELHTSQLRLASYEELNAVKASIKAYDELQKKHVEVDDGLTQLQRDAITTFAVIGKGANEASTVNKQAADTTGSSYMDAFAKSAAAFEQFKGVVVAGTSTMMQSMVAVSDASSWVTRKWQLDAAQRERGEFFLTGFGGGMPTRDAGGPVMAGQPYLVGTGAQPELFIPSSAGTMVPNAGGGGTTVVQLVVDGRVLAEVVNAQNMRTTSQGRLLPSR